MSSRTHRRKFDTKGQKRARSVLAFLLFLTVSLLSLTACVRVSVVSKSALINCLTSDTYVMGVANRAADYARDLCDACSIPYDSTEKTVTFDAIYEVQKAYYSGLLKASPEYTETTYLDYIDAIGEKLTSATQDMLQQYHITADGDAERNAALFSEKVTAYITGITELPFAQQLQMLATFGGTACIVAIAGTALAAIVLVLIIISIGKKRYRALRDIAYSFYAAALLNLLLVLGVEGVKQFKTLVLYPMYLSQAIMNYVHHCQISVSLSAAGLLILGLALTAAVWTMKRNDNN